MFTKHCEFMNQFWQSQIQHDNKEQFNKFLLSHIEALPHDKIIVKHLIKNQDEVKFWYWQNNMQIDTLCIQMDKLLSNSRLFVKHQFVVDDDNDTIENVFVMKTQNL